MPNNIEKGTNAIEQLLQKWFEKYSDREIGELLDKLITRAKEERDSLRRMDDT